MRTRTIAIVGVLVVAWAVSFSAAQTTENDARALAAQRREAAEIAANRKAEGVTKARAAMAAKLTGGAKTELGRFVAYQVPQARAVGVGSVLAAKVRSVPLEGGGAGVEFHTLEVSPAKMLYGPRPKGKKVSLSVLPPRDLLVPKLTKGDKTLFALGQTPRHSLGAVHWSKQAEEAVLFALAPGWERGKCFRCPWCRGKEWTAGKGKCGLCGGATGSGEFKLCPKCAAPAGRCQMCKRTVGPATRGVRLGLTCLDPRANAQVAPAAMAEASIEHGQRVRLWVSASVKGKVAVAELLCPAGKELAGCETLCFIVESPGRKEQAVLFSVLPLRGAEAKLQPKPLTNSAASSRMFAAEMVLNDKKKVFERPGRYTVRAAAGRLVSRPVTVVVKEHKLMVAVPRPRPRPAWLDNVVPQITPDGKGVQATMNGKMLWKMRTRDGVRAVEQKDGLVVVTSQDGKTVITLDLATGTTISKRVAR